MTMPTLRELFVLLLPVVLVLLERVRALPVLVTVTVTYAAAWMADDLCRGHLSDAQFFFVALPLAVIVTSTIVATVMIRRARMRSVLWGATLGYALGVAAGMFLIPGFEVQASALWAGALAARYAA